MAQDGGCPTPQATRTRDLALQVSARSSLLILSPAATTAAACNRPGDLVRRSIGPDTETAASTRPPGPRTGADTDATPGSRSAAVAAQPRRARARRRLRSEER